MTIGSVAQTQQNVFTPETDVRLLTTQQTQHLFLHQKDLEISDEDEYQQQYQLKAKKESKSEFDIDFYKKSSDEISDFDQCEGGDKSISKDIDTISESQYSQKSNQQNI